MAIDGHRAKELNLWPMNTKPVTTSPYASPAPDSSEPIVVSSFYQFIPLEEAQLPELRQKLKELGESLGLKGLFLLSTEGFNATVSGPREALNPFRSQMEALLGTGEDSPAGPVFYKDSLADKQVFLKMRVKIRPEIVTLGNPQVVPQSAVNHHLEPEEWHRILQDEDVVVLDTRNRYEYEIGKFKGAIDLNIDEFQSFPQKAAESGIPKDKKILMYCTGGIRCEKALIEMKNQGYREVYQLNGGIINYLERFPQGHWEGECFVFDYRVAVDSQLKPSKTYGLCPHCGQPAKEKISCRQCGHEDVVCNHCLGSGDPALHTCSKNCAHHFRMGHKSTRPHLDPLRRRGLESTSGSRGNQ